SGTLTFAPGETSKPVNVTVKGDIVNELDETLQLTVNNATNAVVLAASKSGTGFILNDDPQPTATISDVSIVEGNTGTSKVSFTVGLPSPIDFLSFHGLPADGTAKSGLDYQGLNPSISFSAGFTSQTVDITILGDTFTESDETFGLSLIPPFGRVTVAKATGTAMIVNDDPTSGT